MHLHLVFESWRSGLEGFIRQTSFFSTCLFDVTAHHVTKKSVSKNWRVPPSAGSSSWLCKLLTSWFEIPSGNSSDPRIGWLLRDASALETPPPKKKRRPGVTSLAKWRPFWNVSEFCQKKSLIASGKNNILTWLDVGFFCCCFLSNEPLELPQTKVLDVLLADSQSKISHIASNRLWLWWSAGFFWGNCRGFWLQTLGTPRVKFEVSQFWSRKNTPEFNIAPWKKRLCTLVSFPNRQTEALWILGYIY